MNFPLFIAKRYLISKRKKNFINIISILSIIGVAVCTAALVIAMSVFNGLESLLSTLNSTFDPDLKIVPATGKSFERTDELLSRIREVEGVEEVVEVIEDYSYATYRNADQIVILKGVSEGFIEKAALRDYIVDGKDQLYDNGMPKALIGRGVQYALSVPIANDIYPLQLYYIKPSTRATLDPSQMYTQRSIMAGGVFSVLQNYDENYIIVPLSFVVDLFNYGNNRTAFEVEVAAQANEKSVQTKLSEILGDAFAVLNKEQQHKDLYKLLRMEKLFTFLALTLLLIIGSVSILFGLLMLALDKKKDISVLVSLGATPTLIRKIFLMEGALIAIIGSVGGLVIGIVLCLLQAKFGFISMGMETSVVPGYPVKVIFTDVLSIALVTMGVTFLIAYRPAVLASRTFSIRYL